MIGLNSFLTVIYVTNFVEQIHDVRCIILGTQRQELTAKLHHPFHHFWHGERSNSQSAKGFKRQKSLPDPRPLKRATPASGERCAETGSGNTTTSIESKKNSNSPKRTVPQLEPRAVNPPAGPALIDWRKSPYYPKVRDQGSCSACWAFSGVSVLEIMYSWHRLTPTYLSYQQVIDCCPDTFGCFCGSSLEGLRYLVSVGVTFEKTYPYVEQKTACRSDFEIAAKAKSFKRIKNNEKAIVQALHRSPLVVSLHCPIEIKGYKEGVANPASCKNDEDSCTHTAAIVGHGKDYWIIRNSYGEKILDSGHYLLKKGTCGVGLRVWSVTIDGFTPDRSVISKVNEMHPSGLAGIAKIFRSISKSCNSS